MAHKTFQCPHCGYISKENGYFSEEYANYYSRKPFFILTWCYNCSHVTIRKRPWYIPFLPIVKPYKTMDMLEAAKEPSYFLIKDRQLGFKSTDNLNRMIWNSLVRRAHMETGKEEDYEHATHLLLDKFHPYMASAIATIAELAPTMTHPVQQLSEGAYYRDSFRMHDMSEENAELFHEQCNRLYFGQYYRTHFTLEDIMNWAETSPRNKEKAQKMIAITREFLQAKKEMELE